MSNRNIDLGTFQWDSNKLTDQIAANYLEMQRFSNSLKTTQDSLKATNNQIKELEKKIENERKSQELLNRALAEGTISQADYNQELADSTEQMGAFVAEQQQAIKAQADYIIEVMQTQNEVANLRTEQRELNRLMQAGREELDGSEGAYKRLNNQLSDAKLEAKNLGAQLYELGQTVDKNSEEYKQLEARYEATANKADELNTTLKQLDSSVGDNQRNVGDYKEAITSAFSEITQGAMRMASGDVMGGFESMKAGFSGVMESAKGLQAFFLSNPYTAILLAVVAVTAGIVAGANEIFQYNEKVREHIALTENLTGTTGKLADDIRVRAQALADTFGGDFEENLKAANTLAKQLGVSYEEAFNKIEQGYIRGANANGDFLDRLTEYGPLLDKYGFDIDEIIGLQIQAQEQGLFNDKFEDSLKEAGIALDEFTKAQADALTAAFGKDFSDKISRDINSGALSVKDALLLMSTEAKKQGLSVQQFGQITADVFKGAGEDVGGAQVIFENLYEGINKLDQPLTRTQQKTLELSQANLELAKAKDEALKSDGIIELQKNWEIATTKITTAWYGFVGSLMDGIKWLDEITGTSEILFELFQEGQNYINELGNVFDELVATFTDLASALGINTSEGKEFLKTVLSFFNPLNALKLIYKGLVVALQGFQMALNVVRVDAVAFVNTVKTVFSQLGAAISAFDITKPIESLKRFADINIKKTFADARKEAEATIKTQEKLKKSFEGDVAKEKTKTPASDKNASTTQADRDKATKAVADGTKQAAPKRSQEQKKAVDDAKKALEEEAKRQIEISKEASQQKIDIAKTELAEYISANADKYKDDKTLLQKKLQDQLAYLDEVKRLQQIATEEERKAKESAIQTKIDEIEKKKELNVNDKEELANLKSEIEILNREYALKDVELTNQTNEKKKEISKKYEDDVLAQKQLSQALEFQQRILDLEANHASEFEIRRVQLDQDTQQKLDAFLKENELKRTLDQENYDTNAEILAQRKELENQIALTDDENEKLRLSNKLTQLTQLEQEAAVSRKQIDDAVTQSKIDGFATVFGMARQAFGEQTAVGKASAIAETTINTYKAAQSAYASLAGIPIVGPGLGAAAAALAVVAGLKNVQKIALTKDKFARGGIISGPSHANGGVPILTPTGMIEAEGGESIINKNSTRMFARELSAINEAGGGKKIFAKGGVISGNLAGIQNSVGGGQDFSALTEAIQEAVATGSAQGTATGSRQGMENLNSNIKIKQGANF